ncbi:hypothetical protein [Streptomyces auratus]|uniref:Uncharacterized protein n=1 Tax=Streptomyces auratus AGR0001 TaxID=1160718 RepID=J1S8K1_9ACTN|nr:hypothetical protein [Streptomyces auratus]QTZ93772.1 hypothetical protein SU9_021885 [Streptomyces auratus AGR0001]
MGLTLLARKFPGARHVTKTRSDHNIQNNQPQLVIDAVREVVEKARGPQSGK